MGLICKIAGHNWALGHCRRCGEKHAKHQWAQIPGECLQHCLVCGERKATAHQWMPVEGKCAEKCAICGTRQNTEHHYVRCRCTRCGDVKHHFSYKDGDVTDLLFCGDCGAYALPVNLRARTEAGTVEMYEKLMVLHEEILPQIFTDGYHIRKIAGYALRFPNKVAQIFNTLYEHGIQTGVIDEMREKIKENKECRPLSEAEIRRQEYDDNTDEGIFKGGVRSGW